MKSAENRYLAPANTNEPVLPKEVKKNKSSALLRKVLLGISSAGLAISATLNPIVSNNAHAQETTPTVPASFPKEKLRLLEDVYHLPPEYLEAIRNFSNEALQQAKNDTNPRQVIFEGQEINFSPGTLLEFCRNEEEIRRVIEYYITFSMVNADELIRAGHAQEELATQLIDTLNNVVVHWDTNYTLRFALLTEGAFNKTQKVANQMYPQGEFSPLPGFDTENPALLEALVKQYPSRKILAYIVTSMQGNQEPLAEIGSTSEQMYQEKIHHFLAYILVNVTNELIADKISHSGADKPNSSLSDFSEVEIEKITDDLFAHINTMLFPGYDPDEVAILSTLPNNTILNRWRDTEQRKLRTQLRNELITSVRALLDGMKTTN